MVLNRVGSRIRRAIDGQTLPAVALIFSMTSFAVPAMDFSAWTPENAADSQVRARVDQANCLWYASRNHGFYFLQQQAISGEATGMQYSIWLDFVESVGLSECGSGAGDPVTLKAALITTQGNAERMLAAVN